MPIRSLDQLVQFLEEELAWRKRELTTLKFMVDKARPHERVLLLRAAVCLLYAHWEGFVKAATTGYVSFVATRGLRYQDLTPNFVALGLRSDIAQAGRSNLPTLHTALTTQLMAGLSENANIDWEQSINTRSNLNSDTLNEILCVVGLDATEYLSKKPIIDQRLLGNRNPVAHGEQRPGIEPDDYVALHDDIIQLVERFRNDIENAAATNSYRINLVH
jgi:hypothetical protein